MDKNIIRFIKDTETRLKLKSNKLENLSKEELMRYLDSLLMMDMD